MATDLTLYLDDQPGELARDAVGCQAGGGCQRVFGGGSRLVTFAHGSVGGRAAGQEQRVIPRLAPVGPLRQASLKNGERSLGVAQPQADGSGLHHGVHGAAVGRAVVLTLADPGDGFVHRGVGVPEGRVGLLQCGAGLCALPEDHRPQPRGECITVSEGRAGHARAVPWHARLGRDGGLAHQRVSDGALVA